MTYLLIPANYLQETINAILSISNALTFQGNYVFIKYNPTQNFNNIRFDQVIEINAKTSQSNFQPQPQYPNTQTNFVNTLPNNFQTQYKPNPTQTFSTNPNPQISQQLNQQFPTQAQPFYPSPNQSPQQVQTKPIQQGINTTQEPQTNYPQSKLPENILPKAQNEITPIDPKLVEHNSKEFSPTPKAPQSMA